MIFELMEYEIDSSGKIAGSRVTGEEFFPCDEVILAIGQENAFPWVERDIRIEFDRWGVPVVDRVTYQCTREGVFFGGDAALAPRTSSGRSNMVTRRPFPFTSIVTASRLPSVCRRA